MPPVSETASGIEIRGVHSAVTSWVLWIRIRVPVPRRPGGWSCVSLPEPLPISFLHRWVNSRARRVNCGSDVDLDRPDPVMRCSGDAVGSPRRSRVRVATSTHRHRSWRARPGRRPRALSHPPGWYACSSLLDPRPASNHGREGRSPARSPAPGGSVGPSEHQRCSLLRDRDPALLRPASRDLAASPSLRRLYRERRLHRSDLSHLSDPTMRIGDIPICILCQGSNFFAHWAVVPTVVDVD